MLRPNPEPWPTQGCAPRSYSFYIYSIWCLRAWDMADLILVAHVQLCGLCMNCISCICLLFLYPAFEVALNIASIAISSVHVYSFIYIYILLVIYYAYYARWQRLQNLLWKTYRTIHGPCHGLWPMIWVSCRGKQIQMRVVMMRCLYVDVCLYLCVWMCTVTFHFILYTYYQPVLII